MKYNVNHPEDIILAWSCIWGEGVSVGCHKGSFFITPKQ